MSTNPFSRDVPVGGYALPYQREEGDAPLEVVVIPPGAAGEHETALAGVTELIGWAAPPGRAFPDGRLQVVGTSPSRTHLPKLAVALGSRVAVCADTALPALIEAWEQFLARYRDAASALVDASRSRRAQAPGEAAEGRDRYRSEMEAWAHAFGSGQLHHALKHSERPQRVYRSERRQRELPGFHIDANESWRADPLRDAPQAAVDALEAVQAHLDNWQIEHDRCDLVFVPEGQVKGQADGRAAVRITGWLHRHALFGFISASDGSGGSISGRYPDDVRVATGSALRPTAYASAYGVRHPAAQEALRHGAVVAIDLFVDGQPQEVLKEYLPPDAHDLIDDGLIDDVCDTLFLVGWKLAQPVRHEISNYAEQIAAHLILSDAQGALEMYGESLSESAYNAAQQDLENLLERILDEDWLYDDLPQIEDLSLAQLVPSGTSRESSLWAPWRPGAGDPAPRTTDGHEPVWTLTDEPGKLPGGEVRAAERAEDKRREPGLPAMFEAAHWREGPDATLHGVLPDQRLLVLTLPNRSARSGSRSSPWFVRCFPDESRTEHSDSEWLHRLSWEQVFELLPSKAHPLAVDAVLAEVEAAKDWAVTRINRVLPGGRFDELRSSAQMLTGIETLRDQLERCRRMGVLRDRRLTARGLRHDAFGRKEQMRFEALVRCTPKYDDTFEDVQANLRYLIDDLESLPISVELEKHTDDEQSIVVRCGLAVTSVGEAADVANELISQVHWWGRLQPIDFDSGRVEDEVCFEIRELETTNDDSVT